MAEQLKYKHVNKIFNYFVKINIMYKIIIILHEKVHHQKAPK